MPRRWLIRSFFIALLAICLATWVAGYFQMAVLGYSPPSRYVCLAVEAGSLEFEISDDFEDPTGTWVWLHRPVNLQQCRQEKQMAAHHFAGFAYHEWQTTEHTVTTWIPMWFPTLLATTLLWFTWQKTRPKSTTSAFPIEPDPAKALAKNMKRPEARPSH